MAAPAILIPSGLRAVHPQLEESFKSIQSAFSSLQSAQAASAGGAGATSLSTLQSQVKTLQQQVAALQAAVGALAPAVYKAAEVLPAYTAVYEVAPGLLAVADDSAQVTSYALVGVTTAVAAPGTVVTLARDGDTISVSFWDWIPAQPVFLDVMGALTQTLPTTGYVVPVGAAVSATAVLIALGEPAGFSTGNTDAVVGRAAAGELNLQWLPLLPSLNAIAAGNTVDVPAFCNFLTASSSGLALDGDLILDGDLVEISA